MPLPPQTLQALMDLSTGRTAIPITLPPTNDQLLMQMRVSPLANQPNETAGVMNPKHLGRKAESKELQKQLIETDPDVQVEEMKPVPAQQILDKHHTIPSTRDEPESVAL